MRGPRPHEARYCLRWISVRDACAFVRRHHRHHQPPQGAIGACACYSGAILIGVAIVGRPVSRLLACENTAEITRLCVLDDYRNAASWLYTRAKRLAQAWGFQRVVTYTVPTLGETGASLKAAGFVATSETDGGSWNRPSRPRADSHPLSPKMRWEAPCHDDLGRGA